jgi:signal transduction histidine kinase
MELHGGSLALASKLGVGTQASITFPPQRAVFEPSTAHSLSAA